jgi:hypothetical protein
MGNPAGTGLISLDIILWNVLNEDEEKSPVDKPLTGGPAIRCERDANDAEKACLFFLDTSDGVARWCTILVNPSRPCCCARGPEILSTNTSPTWKGIPK